IDHDIENSPIIVLAPTGVAAFNIHSKMIYSALSIPVTGTNFDIAGKRLKKLQKKLTGVVYVIIDEKSMVGCRMLVLIDMRLYQAFSEHQNQPFGGQSVILVGDFGQLPLVLDYPMYAQSLSHDPLSNDGIVAYKQFQEVYQLDIVHCQSDDSDEQLLSTQFNGSSSIQPSEYEQFSDTIYILLQKVDVDKVNISKLRSLNRPIARIHAVHTGIEASKADSDIAKEVRVLCSKQIYV
ncbi:17951_t:CDS:2, partial [Racocetra fulgida]